MQQVQLVADSAHDEAVPLYGGGDASDSDDSIEIHVAVCLLCPAVCQC